MFCSTILVTEPSFAANKLADSVFLGVSIVDPFVCYILSCRAFLTALVWIITTDSYISLWDSLMSSVREFPPLFLLVYGTGTEYWGNLLGWKHSCIATFSGSELSVGPCRFCYKPHWPSMCGHLSLSLSLSPVDICTILLALGWWPSWGLGQYSAFGRGLVYR